MSNKKPAKLALEDGTIVQGWAIGAMGETSGELCFNTSMTGYQEIMTDPSYFGQLMMMTYPHIGNYGAHDEDTEANAPMIAGLITRSFSSEYSNSLAQESLNEYMSKNGLSGISGVDTRGLVMHIRKNGVMNAVISSSDLDDASLVRKAKAVPKMAGLELATKVTKKEAFDYCTGDGYKIAVFDYGVKLNILRSFEQRGCQVRVFPAQTPVEEVDNWGPDGVFLSNGPGDPRPMDFAIETVNHFKNLGLPLFGICLGHQLLALSEGLEVYKMKVGHRGANQPVQNLKTGKVEISTQNHGFAVRKESLSDDVAIMSHKNLNDDSLEGLDFQKFPGFSVQYHPEASPGPHDSQYLFDKFMDLISEHKNANTNKETSRA